MSVILPLARGSVQTALPALIVGILNVTPDSFWEGSRVASCSLDTALKMIDDGADILDIGGESSRPGSQYVSEGEEIQRIIPLIRAIRSKSSLPISVDTRKAAVLRAALDEGADMLNDISALEDDPLMADMAAREAIPVILMHKQGIPLTMQNNPRYEDCGANVRDYLFSRARFAESRGIAKEKIILDPGIGFGKKLADNLSIVRNLERLCESGYPVMAALSRKACIGEITGKPVEDRLAGTLAANLLCAQRGARLLRVHDVRETRDMLSILKEF